MDTVARNIDRWCHHTVYGSSLKAQCNIKALHHSDDVTEQLIQYIGNDECFVETTATAAAPSHVTSNNGLLPGRPLEYSPTGVSIKEYDVESVSSVSAATLEFTMITNGEDSDSEFFDALDNSIKVTSSPVTMTTENSSTNFSITANSKVTSSSSTTTKEEVIPLYDSNSQPLNVRLPVSLTTLLYFYTE